MHAEQPGEERSDITSQQERQGISTETSENDDIVIPDKQVSGEYEPTTDEGIKAAKEYDLRISEAEKALSSAQKEYDSEYKSICAEPTPIGKGPFGNIYDQFKGKAKEAFSFLIKHQDRDLLSVFHHKEIGDIDLVWGDEKGGLSHIIQKHIKEHSDFNNIDEAVSVIEDVIKNGDIIVNGKLRYKCKSYTVTIRKDFDGVKKNWVVTAIDESRGGDKKELPPIPRRPLMV